MVAHRGVDPGRSRDVSSEGLANYQGVGDRVPHSPDVPLVGSPPNSATSTNTPDGASVARVSRTHISGA